MPRPNYLMLGIEKEVSLERGVVTIRTNDATRNPSQSISQEQYSDRQVVVQARMAVETSIATPDSIAYLYLYASPLWPVAPIHYLLFPTSKTSSAQSYQAHYPLWFLLFRYLSRFGFQLACLLGPRKRSDWSDKVVCNSARLGSFLRETTLHRLDAGILCTVSLPYYVHSSTIEEEG